MYLTFVVIQIYLIALTLSCKLTPTKTSSTTKTKSSGLRERLNNDSNGSISRLKSICYGQGYCKNLPVLYFDEQSDEVSDCLRKDYLQVFYLTCEEMGHYIEARLQDGTNGSNLEMDAVRRELLERKHYVAPG